jgi:hypothetical protein
MGATALLPFRRKACWGFFGPEKPDGFGRVWTDSKGQHATSRPPKPLTWCLHFQRILTTESADSSEMAVSIHGITSKNTSIWTYYHLSVYKYMVAVPVIMFIRLCLGSFKKAFVTGDILYAHQLQFSHFHSVQGLHIQPTSNSLSKSTSNMTSVLFQTFIKPRKRISGTERIFMKQKLRTATVSQGTVCVFGEQTTIQEIRNTEKKTEEC